MAWQKPISAGRNQFLPAELQPWVVTKTMDAGRGKHLNFHILSPKIA